ncbi:hypothetical protein RB623_24340 [Mesorhizobium sp. LHD-90]|uniref:hypothetical protein n=1 Tax=Mesorhizobium sp. LHD-90 TaxID=3071414 RepID=UPI0027DFE66C|nr:hypothetical protein [Mesorhizobium sp. LHD-90]MDQ6437195.1 hypothetical protein [Mesorhizobium sp. LHD-90]
MNAYLEIFSDVLRLATFQVRQRPMRQAFPKIVAAVPGRDATPTERIGGGGTACLPAGRRLDARG